MADRYEGECYLCDQIEWLEGKEEWAGMSGAGVIISKREIEGQASIQEALLYL